MINEVAPDVPQMRSVLIRSTQVPSIPSRSSHFDTKHDFLRSERVEATPSIKSRVGTSWKPRNVPKLPEMYPLERSHATINDADTIEIAERIAECLRTKSIAATFDEVSLENLTLY